MESDFLIEMFIGKVSIRLGDFKILNKPTPLSRIVFKVDYIAKDAIGALLSLSVRPVYINNF